MKNHGSAVQDNAEVPILCDPNSPNLMILSPHVFRFKCSWFVSHTPIDKYMAWQIMAWHHTCEKTLLSQWWPSLKPWVAMIIQPIRTLLWLTLCFPFSNVKNIIFPPCCQVWARDFHEIRKLNIFQRKNVLFVWETCEVCHWGSASF